MLGRGAVTKDRPINVRAQVFAADGSVRGTLNVGTPFGRRRVADNPLVHCLRGHAHELG